MVLNTDDEVRAAIFLDRDGVINPLVFNPTTLEYESPHYPNDFAIYPNAITALKNLQERGFLLFLVSNQPSYAKGKTSMNNLNAIHDLLINKLESNNIYFTKYYYCYHHPNGVVPELTKICDCRKPGIKFIMDANEQFNVDLTTSYFIGDQDTDVICGQNANMKTVLILNEHSYKKRGSSSPDLMATNLLEASELILKSDIGGY